MIAEKSAGSRRCAIYTRKSSSEGLERNFNSLDAQRQFCESYIASQGGDGWWALATRYDDGGFSGGSLQRPAVLRLMDDIAAGLIDAVVVYKIDRLSRSLIDFASLLGRFEQHGVGFVSVTQAFSTTSSMGRLTLNVLLSFAQFEREIASERLRDKAAASRARGLWQAGGRPFGYQLEKGRLTIDDREADVIRYAFARYPEIGGARLLAEEMTARSALNKVGTPFTASTVIRMLKNRLYRGDLVHRGQPIHGLHNPIVSERDWTRVREAMARVAARHRPLPRPNVPNPLKGRIFGPSGELISHDFVYNHARKIYRYYMPSGRLRYGIGTTPRLRFRAAEFDSAVLDAIRTVAPMAIDEASGEPAILRRLVRRIDIGPDEMTIGLRTGAVVKAAVAGRIGAPPRRHQAQQGA